jgi:hypothetical protein
MSERPVMYEKIITIEPLRTLYINDSLFHKVIDHSLNNGVSFEDALIAAVTYGYAEKQSIFDEFVNCKSLCSRPNVLTVKN